MSDLAALLARIELAEGPDAELIYDVCEALLPPSFKGHDDMTDADLRLHKFLEAEAWESAAIAICERVLPVWDWSLETSETMVGSRVFRASDATIVGPARDCVPVSGQGDSPALALCAAVVKAEIERRGKKP